MKKAIIAALLGGLYSSAWATCIGSDSLQTCFDDSGNSYTVTRIGDMTMVDGHNARTGSSWNQTSQQIGNTTITNGSAANGNSWNSTTTNMGNGMTSTYGQDSRGRSFQRTCGPYGCY